MNLNLKIKEETHHGVKVIHVHEPHSLLTQVAFYTMSGSFAEKPKHFGVAHYLEHMFFKGTENRTAERISEDASLGGFTQNAYTSETTVCYHLTGPAQNWEKGVDLLCDQMFNSTFPKDEVNSERTVIQEERKMYDDRHDSSFWLALEREYLNDQLNHDVIGTEETINNITRKTLVKYKQKMMGKGNLTLLISGPQTHEEVFNNIGKYLYNNGLTKSKKVKIEGTIINKDNFKNKSITRAGIQQTFLAFVIDKGQSAFDNSPEYGVMMRALGGGMSSKLFKTVREEHGLCYSISAMPFFQTEQEGVSLITTQLGPHQTEKCKELIIDILKDIKENGFSEMEFACSKAQQIASWSKTLESPKKLGKEIFFNSQFNKGMNLQERYDQLNNLDFKKFNKWVKKWMKDAEGVWFQMDPMIAQND